jgi:molybdenum cofactor cytidylyltransferase
LAVYCVVPAAGESSRFPWNKLLYKYSDKPVIAQTLSNIIESGVFKRIVVVLGYQSELVAEALRDFEKHLDIIVNPGFKQGMSASIKLGVEYIAREYSDVRIIGVNPGDVAWIHPGVYANVVVRFSEQLGKFCVAVATYRGIRGHPILFSSVILKDLLSISEEKAGLKEVTRKYRDKTLLVESGYPGVILDLDTVLDLLRIKQLVYK